MALNFCRSLGFADGRDFLCFAGTYFCDWEREFILRFAEKQNFRIAIEIPAGVAIALAKDQQGVTISCIIITCKR